MGRIGRSLAVGLFFSTGLFLGCGSGDEGPTKNIVPLAMSDSTIDRHGGGGGGGTTFTYRGGPVLQNPTVFAIFLGPSWGTGNSDSQYLTSFWSDFTAASGSSSWYTHMTKTNSYSVSGSYTVHAAKFGGSAIDSTNYGSTVTDAQLQATVSRNVASHSTWKVADALYVVITGKDVQVTMGGSATCTGFCGYHNNFSDPAHSANSNGDLYYASTPYLTCAGCSQSPFSPLDITTTVSSHEFGEAVSDPVPGTGWYSSRHGENGDICAWGSNLVNQSFNGSTFTVQKIWDNVTSACSD